MFVVNFSTINVSVILSLLVLCTISCRNFISVAWILLSSFFVQSFLLKCRLQHSSQWWQPLIAQVPAGKLKATPPWHGGLQLSKITKKNNHVPYNMRCWKCCPPSSTHFWHLFRKRAFTCIKSSSEIESISRLILTFNSSNVWGFVAYTLFFKSLIDKNHELPQY